MNVVGITGAFGFFGFHLRARLLAIGIEEVRTAGRETMGSPAATDRFLDGCEVVFHLAGANRGDPADVEAGNVNLATALVEAKERTGSRFILVFANSVQAGQDTPYGRSKQEAAERLAAAQRKVGDRFVDTVLPHLFGEHGRPFYNSGVTTFAHQIATGGQPQIIVDSELNLVYVQDAVKSMIDAVADPTVAEVRPSGKRIMVSDALATLQRLAEPYLTGGVVPRFVDLFELRMFNMFRSQLFPRHCPLRLQKTEDHRGVFIETIRSDGKGQASISTTGAGVTRGDHYHFDKIERFAVVRGDAVIRVRRLFDDFVHVFEVSGDEPVAIDMPTLHPHNITNVGSTELVTQFWTNDLFDPNRPDTIPEPV